MQQPDDILAYLDAPPPVRGPLIRRPPAVAAARAKEQRNRSAEARSRTERALRRAYPDEYDALYAEAKRRVDAERGPLPGDES